MQRSAIARLQIKNLVTLISDSLKTTTSITDRLPTNASTITHQTDILNQDAPMISSQGFKAFGSGWHSTSGALKEIHYKSPKSRLVFTYLKINFPHWKSTWLSTLVAVWKTPMSSPESSMSLPS